uniref:Mediator of DNA damage checkpoint protein 1 n=1 Tax=Nannospalax galili TaxID=1026970 RepID=A0A8C6QJ23_NANGA
MEDTQAVCWDDDDDEEEDKKEPLQCKLEPVGQLHIFSSTHGPETDFPLYLGKNVVGRNPDCSVVLPFPSISRCHAEIKISAWDKAPLLQDCGSLNGTHIIRPPKALGRGVSHRLRDQEFFLFANLPCQYRHLNVPLHLVSRGPLLIEETPRLQGRSQSSRVLLAEDSDEERSFPSGRRVVNGSRTVSSPTATVVPESDEEGPSPDVSGSCLAFKMDSDTEEELGQQSGVGAAPAEAGRATGIQLVNIQPTKQRSKDTKVKRKAGSGVAVGSILERCSHLGQDSDTDVDEEHQPSGFVDSDTDVEQIPATPVVVPVRKRLALHGVSTRGPGASAVAHLQDSPAGGVRDMEEGAAPHASTLERSHITVVISSDTDDEEAASVALTLAHLKGSSAGAASWSRDPAVGEAQLQVLQQSQSASGRDSDTDVEDEGPPGCKKETVPNHPVDRGGAPVLTHTFKREPSDIDKDVDVSIPGSQLENTQASLAMIGNHAEMEEEVQPGRAVPLGEKYQVPVEGTHQTDASWEGLENRCGERPVLSSGRYKKQLPAAGDARTEWAPAVLEQESTLQEGAQGRSPVAPVEQVVVYTGTPGEPTQPQRGGTQTPTGREREAHVGGTKNCTDHCDDSEDLCLPETQCFVKRERESPEAVPSLEDEPTQAFLYVLPQELDSSHCRLRTPGALGVPWEDLATQPFDPSEFDAEPQPTAIHPEVHGSLPRAPPQHPNLVYTSQVHTEPLGIQGSEMQTMEKAMGIPKETVERVTPGRGPPEREMRERPPDTEQEHVMGEELTWGTEDRLQKQVFTGDRQTQDGNPEGDRESMKVETETAKDQQEGEGPGPERKGKPAGPERTLARRPTMERSHDQEGQVTSPTPEPEVGAEELEGLASTLVVSGSQGDGGKGDPVSPGRKQRGQLSCKMPSAAKKVRIGCRESPAPRLLPTVPGTSAPPQSTSQIQKHSAPQPLISPSSPSEQHLCETPHIKPNVGSRRSSRITSPPSSAASPTDQPAAPRPISRATRGRATRFSIRTPEPIVPTNSELQLPASTDQPVIPKPPSWRVTRGRTSRSSVKTPEPVIPTGPEIQPPMSIDQPVTPNLIFCSTRGRPSKSFVKTPEPLVSFDPKLQPPTSTDQTAIPKSTSRVTRVRTNRSSAKTLEPVVPIGPELQPPTSTNQPVTPNLTSQSTRGRPSKSSIETPEPDVPTAPEFQPPIPIGQPVIPEATGQSRTLKSSSLNTAPVSTPTEQPPVATAKPAPLDPVAQVSHGRKRRAAGKQGSHTVPISRKPCSILSEPESQPSTQQSLGAKPLAATPEPAGPQLPETLTHAQAALIQNQTAVLTPELKPEASEILKRLSTTTDSLPLQKHPRREVSQKTLFPKEEDVGKLSIKEEPQDQAIPEPGKRKRDHGEDELQGTSNRSLRRTKPNQEAEAPKVLFTGVVDSRGERTVLSLGGSVASSVNEASYLVTDRIRRTVKFLCALGRGIPILSLNWLYQSRKAGYFLPPDEYLVTDAEQEKNFNFSLRDSLNRAQEQRLLQGYEIHVTPGVQPPPPQMGEIINSCGGTVLPSMPRSYKPHRVVITCAQDLPRCTTPSRLGVPLVSSEFLLTGVLRQEATPEAFVLSSLETLPT